MGEEAEQKRALGVRGKMISPFFHQLSLKQGQMPPPSSHTSAHLTTGRMASGTELCRGQPVLLLLRGDSGSTSTWA